MRVKTSFKMGVIEGEMKMEFLVIEIENSLIDFDEII